MERIEEGKVPQKKHCFPVVAERNYGKLCGLKRTKFYNSFNYEKSLYESTNSPLLSWFPERNGYF